jgi:hypothetical protein
MATASVTDRPATDEVNASDRVKRGLRYQLAVRP